MKNITIETVNDGDVGQCRELCNELMKFQKSQAKIGRKLFDGMNFDTRMKKSFEKAYRNHLVVVKDDGIPVGYIFSTVDYVTEADRATFPEWAPKDGTGFYPDWIELPQKIGVVSNLYLCEGYRGTGLGNKLCDMALEWMDSFDDVKKIFVFISNGNDKALDFYINNGFTYSHEVFGGFIKAAYISK